MPEQTEAERLEHLPPLDFSAVNVTVGQAQALAGTSAVPRLTSLLERPVYQFTPGRIVFADTAELFDSSIVSSQQIVADYLGVETSRVSRIGLVETPDQWTLQLRQFLPLNKYRVDDGQGSEVYVSSTQARVVLHTTRNDRFLAWIGAIPHWLYFQPLRVNSGLWADVVIWSSAIGTGMAIAGLLLLFLQFRWQRLPQIRRAIPHRGLMRWHYLSGVLFGFVATTWVFSGLLSMGPFSWMQVDPLTLDQDRYRQSNAGEIERMDFRSAAIRAAIDAAAGGAEIKEIAFSGFGDEAWLELAISDGNSHWGHRLVYMDAADTGSAHDLLPQETILQRMQAGTGESPESVSVLTRYDSYYYDREEASGPTRPLPVLRVEYADPARTIFYIDQRTGDPVARSHYWNRVFRWLYSGLHSLDFGSFYRMRPLWDIVTLLLLAGGMVLTFIGAILAFRRLAGTGRPGR